MLNLKSGNFIIKTKDFSIDENGTVDISNLLKATEARIDALVVKDAEIEGNITAINGNITAIEGNISTINGNITTLNGNISTINGNITALNGRVTAAEGQFDNLTVKQIHFMDGTDMSTATLGSVFNGKSYAGHIGAGQRFTNATLADQTNGANGFEIYLTDYTGTNLALTPTTFYINGTNISIQGNGSLTGGTWKYGIYPIASGISTTQNDKTFTTLGRTRIYHYTGNGLVVGSSSSNNNLDGNWWYNTSGGNIATTSDLRYKKEIKDFSFLYEKFFDSLQPKTFQFINGTSGRTHVGFISQQVLNALQQVSLTELDFAGYVLQEPENKDSLAGLVYEEFIALNTWQIQKLKARVAELENKIAQLEQ